VDKRENIDFPRLAAALLERAETLVREWFPAGRKNKHYWYLGDFDGAPGKSANINLKTGAWGDNARPGDSGRDLISLYGRLHGLSNMAAARELAQDQGWMSRPVAPPPPPKAKPKPAIEWMPIHPVPDDAPPYREQWAHIKRGVPPMHWEYRDQTGRLLGLVVRFDTSTGKKDVQPISFCLGSDGRRAWHYKAFNEPRALYGLWRLAAPAEGGASRPLVIVVEGEKKADALYEALGGTTPVVAWPGGCSVPHKADWAALRGYRALCWPDADAQRDKHSAQLLPREQQPGFHAMRQVQALLAELDVPARLVDIGEPGSLPDTWDCADAVADGWTREQLLAFMRNLVPEPGDEPEPPAPEPPPEPAPEPPGGPTPRPPQAPSSAPAFVEDPHWRESYVLGRNKEPRECVPNVMLALRSHPQWHGVLGFDEFAQRLVKRRPAPYDLPGSTSSEWSDVDDTRTAAWLAYAEGMVVSSPMVAEAVNEVARARPFHPVLEWLRSLKHDGIARIDTWLTDFFKIEDTPYVRLVSRYFLLGMCRRVLEPGVKFDYCLVLEGEQGLRKSSALRILGGPWFSDTELDLAHKDAMSSIRGKWLHEFGEMGSLARQESSRQKSFLSRQVDEFRPVWGRREISCPRQTAFCGSTNEWAWNKDPTGGRRFWPVCVTEEIDIAGLAAMRDQLFAEAFARAQAGERFAPDYDQQRELFDPEQFARETPDLLVEALSRWLESKPLLDKVSMLDAAEQGLKLPPGQVVPRGLETRIGNAMKKLGWAKVEHRLQPVRYSYKRVRRNPASSAPAGQAEAQGEAQAEGQGEELEVPF
jgi:putative DNA primase/helicase